ncbi:aminotransferase class V-fold PLP-dependent enzyme [Agromyces atrinae]|uniref:aminotransferase class V-fold PLP-dependent enzyme n=1 Tax=Agromyces atrinae TaxID=592376 RepID=UPI001F570AA5|nr:aminotransferase class V-fold PLP-dependent enzyme [Agromyces atrinae]MCI2957375.1 aminotransferase class V-fold PLP-dependent enzyme [Agromyces atrinae]
MTAVAPVLTSSGRVEPLATLTDAALDVPVLGGARVRHVNLDLAASAPALDAVARRVVDVLPWYSSVHRGSGYPSIVSTDLLESSRDVVGRHVGARSDDTVVITRNTTDSLNLLASAVPGDVVVLDIEHHANLLPWRSRRVVVGRSTIAETLDALRAELASRPAALLAVTAASNVTGEVLPLERFAALAHEHGARIAVDGAQFVPHRRIDIAETGIDYLAVSGHKAYAPFGAGVLVGRRDWLDAAPAYLAGGGAVDTVTADAVSWKPSPERHEAGTPNVLGIVAFAAALVEFESLGEERRGAHERALRERLLTGIRSLEGVRVLGGFDDATDAVGVVTIELASLSVGLVAAALAAEHGIAVRAGRFCAHPFFDRIATRRNGLRASIGLGTSSDDVDRFVDALTSIVTTGPRAEYARGADGWHPVADDRPAPEFGVRPVAR